MLSSDPSHFVPRLDAMVAALFLLEGAGGDTVARYARLYRTTNWGMPQLEVRRFRERDLAWAGTVTPDPLREDGYFSSEEPDRRSDAEAMLFCTGTSRLAIRRSGLLDAAGGEIRSGTITAAAVSNHLAMEAMALLTAADLIPALPETA